MERFPEREFAREIEGRAVVPRTYVLHLVLLHGQFQLRDKQVRILHEQAGQSLHGFGRECRSIDPAQSRVRGVVGVDDAGFETGLQGCVGVWIFLVLDAPGLHAVDVVPCCWVGEGQFVGGDAYDRSVGPVEGEDFEGQDAKDVGDGEGEAVCGPEGWTGEGGERVEVDVVDAVVDD